MNFVKNSFFKMIMPDQIPHKGRKHVEGGRYLKSEFSSTLVGHGKALAEKCPIEKTSLQTTLQDLAAALHNNVR